MDFLYPTPTLCDFSTAASLELKEGEEASEDIKFDPSGQVNIKEEDTENPVTQSMDYESAKRQRGGGFPLLEQIKEELNFLQKEEFIKEEASEPELFEHKQFKSEDTLPESSFECKPFEAKCLTCVTPVKLESNKLIKQELAEDGSCGLPASIEKSHETPGEFPPEPPDHCCADPLPQNQMCSPLRGGCVHRQKDSFPQKDAEAHGTVERMGLRNLPRRCRIDSRNEGNKIKHSSDGGPRSCRFELRSRHKSQPVNQASSSPLRSDSEGDEEEDPTWTPGYQHPPPCHAQSHSRAGDRRSSQPQDVGQAGQKNKLASRDARKDGPASRSLRKPPDHPQSGPKVLPQGRRQRARNSVCSLCQKAFLTSRDLRRHGRIHSGEKPFACTLCARRFNDMGNMRKHMLVHSGEKPHVCAHCKKAFSERGNLRRHQKIHKKVQEKFRCEVCWKSYNEKSGLVRHQRFWNEKGGCLKGRKVKQNLQVVEKAA